MSDSDPTHLVIHRYAPRNLDRPHPNEMDQSAVMIGDDICVRILETRGRKTVVSIHAPPEKAILRGEIYRRETGRAPISVARDA